MAFLSNRNVNYLNLHLALSNLLGISYAIFGPLYFYKLGFSLPAVFLLLALITALRLPLRFVSFPLVRRFGLKTTLIISAAGWGASFPLLAFAKGMDVWMILFLVVHALFNAIHWHCYHTLYSLAGEHEKRGRQVAVSNVASAVATAFAPILSALIIGHIGFSGYFMLAPVLAVVMVLALSRCRDVPVALPPWRKGKKLMFSLGTRIHLAEASGFCLLYYPWIFAVFFYVGKLVSLGSIITFGIVMQILYQLVLGALVDRGRGTLVNHAAGLLRGTQIFGKALLPLSLPVILSLEALSALGGVHHDATQPVAIYNAGKRASQPFWYWLFAESAWDVGAVAACVTAALLLTAGVELRLIILLALIPIGALWWLVYGYFQRPRA